MRIGAKVPNSGPLPGERGIGQMASELEAAGFESLWVSDHVVMPKTIASQYPFAADGRPTWPLETPYYDAMVALAVTAGATRHAVLGTAVLVLPLRQPVIFAKQAATVDVLSGGRLALGIGAGWLAEEFDALNVPFRTRGQRFTEWIEIVRACWSGTPDPFRGEHYELPAGVLCLPTPQHAIPLLVGGHSPTALVRAGSLCDGWVAHQSASAIDIDALAWGIAEMHRAGQRCSKAPAQLWTTLRLIDSATRIAEVAAMLPRLRDIGIDEVVVDSDWSVRDAAKEEYNVLRRSADG